MGFVVVPENSSFRFQGDLKGTMFVAGEPSLVELSKHSSIGTMSLSIPVFSPHENLPPDTNLCLRKIVQIFVDREISRYRSVHSSCGLLKWLRENEILRQTDTGAVFNG